MSLNLIGTYKSSSGRSFIIDFPIQTPTDITMKVLEEEDRDTRFKILKDLMVSWDLHEDLIEEVEDIVKDADIKLECI